MILGSLGVETDHPPKMCAGLDAAAAVVTELVRRLPPGSGSTDSVHAARYDGELSPVMAVSEGELVYDFCWCPGRRCGHLISGDSRGSS